MKIKSLYRLVPSFIRKFFSAIVRRIQTSLRLQLIVLFLLCILASTLSIMVSSIFLEGRTSTYSYVDYNNGIDQIEFAAKNTSESLKAQSLNPVNQPFDQWVNQMIEELESRRYKFMLLDQEGDIRIKSSNVIETKFDFQQLLVQTINNMNESKNGGYNEGQEYTALRPVVVNGENLYLLVQGVPQAVVQSYTSTSQGPLPFIVGLIVFFMLFYYLTKRKMRVIEELAGGLTEVSKGNLKYRLQEKSHDELGTLAIHINRMAEDLDRQIERERAAEKSKNELITNVSHDLRTPLTLIMGYLRAIKDKKYENEAQYEEYLNIATEKSEKLKSLLEDLFEYTKLNNHDILLKMETVSLNELLEQLLEEYVPICEEQQLGLRKDIPQERVMVQLDTNQMVRVFENLLNNAIKYSYRPSMIRVNMKVTEQDVWIQFRNNCDPIPQADLARMFERFYRVDTSRSSKTGGSGLGLAIAKTIITLHDGEIWAEADEDTITITIKLKRWQR